MAWWKTSGSVFLALAMLFSACGRSSGDTTTTTGDGLTTSTQPSSNGTAGTGDTVTPGSGGPGSSTSSPGATSTTVLETVPDYSIESRTAGQGGDTLVILLPAGTYSDLDLENVVVDVVERFAPVATVHVVDDSGVVALVLQPRAELSPADRDLVDEHYFVRLEEGFRLIYEGPFVSVGQVILGS